MRIPNNLTTKEEQFNYLYEQLKNGYYIYNGESFERVFIYYSEKDKRKYIRYYGLGSFCDRVSKEYFKYILRVFECTDYKKLEILSELR